MPKPLHGVIPPLVTPLDPEGALDAPSLERLVARLVDAGASGLFLGGSTGEAALLSEDDQVRAVEVAVSAAAGRVPVLAGAIATGTARVIDLARRVERAGAAAIVATTPFYVVPGPLEVFGRFCRIAAAIDAPLVAYNIPSATHVGIPIPAVETLADRGTIIALKDSSGDLTAFRRITARVGDAISVLSGSETVADLALQVGGDGIVPGLGNVDPHGYVRLQRLADAGERDAAAREQTRLLDLFGIIDIADRSRIGFTAGALGSFKASLWLLGVIASPRTTEPFGPLVDAEVAAIREALQHAGLEPRR